MTPEYHALAEQTTPFEDMLDALRNIKRFGELASVQLPGQWGSSGKKPASKDVWQFPRHMLVEIDAAIERASNPTQGNTR